MEKLEMLEITDKIKNFLETIEGRKFFREITPELTAAARHELKKSLLSPPATVRRRTALLSLLENKINEINIKKSLDNNNPI